MKSEINKLRGILKYNEAILITSKENIHYICKHDFCDGVILITEDNAYLLVDFRYMTIAKKTIKHLEVVIFSSLNDKIKELLKKNFVKSLYVENNNMTISKKSRLSYDLKEDDVYIICDSTLSKKLENMRLIKSPDEKAKISEAQKITEFAFNEILNFIKPNVSEKDIALHLEFIMRKQGATKVAFDLITISGENTALPHGVPSDNLVKEGDFVTLDIGAVFDGYHSDMTRTVGIKHLTDEQIKVYNTVLDAQLKTLDATKSGIKCSELDKIARDIIKNAGYAEFFKHATGHGVGLNIHEEPRISPVCEKFLSCGMVVTVEPGIYIPHKFGVRIEDMVYITECGYENFTNIDKNLIVL